MTALLFEKKGRVGAGFCSTLIIVFQQDQIPCAVGSDEFGCGASA